VIRGTSILRKKRKIMRQEDIELRDADCCQTCLFGCKGEKIMGDRLVEIICPKTSKICAPWKVCNGFKRR
jgi:hypothetical protein